MDLAEALTYMEAMEQRKPGELTEGYLNGVKGRTSALNNIPNHPKKLCVWCNAVPLEGKRRRYCSAICSESAWRYCYPQTPTSKAYVLAVIQKGFCLACGVSHEDELVRRIERKINELKEFRARMPEDAIIQKLPMKMSWNALGYGTGHLWEVDHRIPIHKGGRGIGFENVQVICRTCHLAKTASENRRG